jgi:hypothetical protein
MKDESNAPRTDRLRSPNSRFSSRLENSREILAIEKDKQYVKSMTITSRVEGAKILGMSRSETTTTGFTLRISELHSGPKSCNRIPLRRIDELLEQSIHLRAFSNDLPLGLQENKSTHYTEKESRGPMERDNSTRYPFQYGVKLVFPATHEMGSRVDVYACDQNAIEALNGGLEPLSAFAPYDAKNRVFIAQTKSCEIKSENTLPLGVGLDNVSQRAKSLLPQQCANMPVVASISSEDIPNVLFFANKGVCTTDTSSNAIRSGCSDKEYFGTQRQTDKIEVNLNIGTGVETKTTRAKLAEDGMCDNENRGMRETDNNLSTASSVRILKTSDHTSKDNRGGWPKFRLNGRERDHAISIVNLQVPPRHSSRKGKISTDVNQRHQPARKIDVAG